MSNIDNVYNYFNEEESNDKIFLELKQKVLDDHFNYLNYLKS